MTESGNNFSSFYCFTSLVDFFFQQKACKAPQVMRRILRLEIKGLLANHGRGASSFYEEAHIKQREFEPTIHLINLIKMQSLGQ